ncbi:MAG TPA: hydrogenase maturation protease [Candidatus Omnitrophota bacterium]|nr:hydrogenase maturation protease [Candidatus Omnitrophota bacterium]
MNSTGPKKILLIGYGNVGKSDDGLGPALAEEISRQNFEGVAVESNYLLTVEDASKVAEYDVAIFADASVKGDEPFTFKPILSAQTVQTFSSHSIDPAIVLGLARDLFKAKTKGYVLVIRGYEFDEFGEQLSSRAQDNLLEAEAFLSRLLATKEFDLYDR